MNLSCISNENVEPLVIDANNVEPLVIDANNVQSNEIAVHKDLNNTSPMCETKLDDVHSDKYKNTLPSKNITNSARRILKKKKLFT